MAVSMFAIRDLKISGTLYQDWTDQRSSLADPHYSTKEDTHPHIVVASGSNPTRPLQAHNQREQRARKPQFSELFS